MENLKIVFSLSHSSMIFFAVVIVARGRCRRHGFDPWVGKIPWKKKWQPTGVFLPGKSCGQRSLMGYSPWGHKRVGHD